VLYALLRDRVRAIGAGPGAAFFFATGMLDDELSNPPMDFAVDLRTYPWQAHARVASSPISSTATPRRPR